jgi:predicted nucleotidyltransferase component of viral defense system
MELSDIWEIRKLAIIALFSDDELMEMLVLKGGNAISLIDKEYSRSSIDLDFSMEGDFRKEDLPRIHEKLEKILRATFAEKRYVPFDILFHEKPAVRKESMKEFWGGYRVEFKLAEETKHEEHKHDLQKLRVNSLSIGKAEKKKFTIDISKHEFCGNKVREEVDGYTIFVYSPQMLVIEKIRAICQQMEEYPYGNKSARARDFFDIHLLIQRFNIDLMEADNIELLKLIFQAKEVPLHLIGAIIATRDFHARDFSSVVDTVPAGTELKDFDSYFDFVIEKTSPLEVLWNE